jgi:hypothetical protein
MRYPQASGTKQYPGAETGESSCRRQHRPIPGQPRKLKLHSIAIARKSQKVNRYNRANKVLPQDLIACEGKQVRASHHFQLGFTDGIVKRAEPKAQPKG